MIVLAVTVVIKECNAPLETVLDCLRKHDKLEKYMIMRHNENVYVYYTRDMSQSSRLLWTDKVFEYSKREYTGFETTHLSDVQSFTNHVTMIYRFMKDNNVLRYISNVDECEPIVNVKPCVQNMETQITPMKFDQLLLMKHKQINKSYDCGHNYRPSCAIL